MISRESIQKGHQIQKTELLSQPHSCAGAVGQQP